ncbi:unnamed protein product, partial [Tetraodon nigroviridis]
SQSPSQDRPGLCFSPAPALDLSLSPSSRHTSALSPSPSSPSSLSPSSPLDSPGGSSSPQPHLFSRESAHPPVVEGRASPQGYQFYLPVGSPPGAYIPSSAFVGQSREKPVSPGSSSDGQLACRWMKCHQFFDSLQELVDHINDFHVKPEKDSGYCCQWEGCARNGRGFNARYKMLIHIRTHTNEKPHHCPTCNKSFSRLENLKIHTRSHTGEHTNNNLTRTSDPAAQRLKLWFVCVVGRRETLHLPLRRLQQTLLELQRPIQAHPHPLHRQALLLQDGGLPEALHRSQLLTQAHQGARAFCGPGAEPFEQTRVGFGPAGPPEPPRSAVCRQGQRHPPRGCCSSPRRPGHIAASVCFLPHQSSGPPGNATLPRGGRKKGPGTTWTVGLAVTLWPHVHLGAGSSE